MKLFKNRFTVGTALALSEITNQLLHKVEKNEKGEEVIVDRVLPFRLRYRLERNEKLLDRDVNRFNGQKMIFLAQYGEISEDGTRVELKSQEKAEAYKEALQKVFDSEVEHELIKLEMEDIDLIRDLDLNFSTEVMNVFIGYMVDDATLFKEFEDEAEQPGVVNAEEVKPEVKAPEAEIKTPVVTPKLKEVKTEGETPVGIVEVSEAEKAPAKKTTTKKTATTKTDTAKKTTSSTAKKSTTTKKTSSKKADAEESK